MHSDTGPDGQKQRVALGAHGDSRELPASVVWTGRSRTQQRASRVTFSSSVCCSVVVRLSGCWHWLLRILNALEWSPWLSVSLDHLRPGRGRYEAWPPWWTGLDSHPWSWSSCGLPAQHWLSPDGSITPQWANSSYISPLISDLILWITNWLSGLWRSIRKCVGR